MVWGIRFLQEGRSAVALVIILIAVLERNRTCGPAADFRIK